MEKMIMIPYSEYLDMEVRMRNSEDPGTKEKLDILERTTAELIDRAREIELIATDLIVLNHYRGAIATMHDNSNQEIINKSRERGWILSINMYRGTEDSRQLSPINLRRIKQEDLRKPIKDGLH